MFDTKVLVLSQKIIAFAHLEKEIIFITGKKNFPREKNGDKENKFVGERKLVGILSISTNY